MYLRDKWNRRVFALRKCEKEPVFADFERFIDEEATLVCDPMFSREAIEMYGNGSNNRRKLKCNLTRTKDKNTSGYKSSDQNQCQICDGNHDPDECNKFLSKSVDDRSKLLSEKRLCYGCYEPISKSHYARICSKRRNCKTCDGNHPVAFCLFFYCLLILYIS